MASTVTQQNPERANRLIFIGAVALAVLAAVLVFVALRGTGGDEKASNPPAGPVEVVVAARDIPAGIKITDEMLEVKSVPTDLAIAGSISTKEALADSTTRFPLARGEQITGIKVGQIGGKLPPSTGIPDRKRAVAITVNEASVVGGLPVAGDRVDLAVIGKNKTLNEDDPANGLPVAYVMLQNVEVFSVAQEVQLPIGRIDKDGNPIESETASGNLTGPPEDTDPNPGARTVTLLVNPEHHAAVALASQSYQVYLALRAPGDDSIIEDAENRPVLLPNIE